MTLLPTLTKYIRKPMLVMTSDRWGCWTGEIEVYGGTFYLSDTQYEFIDKFQSFNMVLEASVINDIRAEVGELNFEAFNRSANPTFVKWKKELQSLLDVSKSLAYQFNALDSDDDNIGLQVRNYVMIGERTVVPHSWIYTVKTKLMGMVAAVYNKYSNAFGEGKRYNNWIKAREEEYAQLKATNPEGNQS